MAAGGKRDVPAKAPAPATAGGASCSADDPEREDLLGKDDGFWRAKLTPEQYRILRRAGTEAPFSGKFVDNHEKGVYRCAGCGQVLFRSDTKFDSGSGWPSFFQAVDPKAVTLVDDNAHGMHRVEVRCSRCGGHLGHVFDDGPAPTGKRFCINSMSLDFEKDGKGR